jgi:hypothetical protein
MYESFKFQNEDCFTLENNYISQVQKYSYL